MCRTSLLLSAIILLFAVSCGEKKLPLQLTEINSIADSISGANAPEDLALFRKADSLLRSIDVSRLSENDRMYHSLLRVKLTDKAYLRHPGDTIIRPVVEYAEKHRRCGFLPEALYYGGRVYSDIGDSFTALRYYQDALDNLPDEKRNLNLRCRLLSQTSYLLNSLRLYKEAIPYLEECIAINKELKDSCNIFYNTKDLGAFMFHQKEFDKAESLFKKSLKYSRAVSADDSLTSIVYLAGVKEAKNEIDSALLLIRGIPEQVTDSLTRNMVLAYASDIYRKAGINDTAILYAREIVSNGNPNNKLTGYRILMNSENIAAIPTDSLVYYVRSYAREMERNLNTNGNKLAIIQQAQYNYSIHDRLRREEEQRASLYYFVGIGIFVFAIVSYIYFLYGKIKKKAQLEAALFKIENLNDQLEKEKLERELQRKELLIRQKMEKEKEKIENEHLINELFTREREGKERIIKELLDRQRIMDENLNREIQEKERLHKELLEKQRIIDELTKNAQLESKRFDKQLIEKEELREKLPEKEEKERESLEKGKLLKIQSEKEWREKNQSRYESVREKQVNRETLKERYLEYGRKMAKENYHYEVPDTIRNSRPYKRMRAKFESGENISKVPSLFYDLDRVVELACPDYKTHLALLMGGKINKTFLQTVIMIKCGMTSSEMAKGLKIKAGSVSSRRMDISRKIYGENVGADVIEAIIHAL